jgi:hypothetical protein
VNLNLAPVMNPVSNALDALISDYGIYLYFFRLAVSGGVLLGIGRRLAAETAT